MGLNISLSATKTHLHWIHSEAQLADVMMKSSGPGRNISEKYMKRDRWRIMFDPQMRSAQERKMGGLKMLETHSDENSNEDERDTSVSKPSMIMCRIRESKSRHVKKSLTVPKPTELVSIKGSV